MTDLQVFNSNLESTPKSPINLVSILKNYAQFRPDAYDSGDIDVDTTSGQLFPTATGVSPFEEKTTFAVAPEIDYSPDGKAFLLSIYLLSYTVLFLIKSLWFVGTPTTNSDKKCVFLSLVVLPHCGLWGHKPRKFKECTVAKSI